MNAAANIISNFASILPNLQILLFTASTVIGLFVCIYGVVMLFYKRQHQSGGQSSMAGAWLSIFVGGVMASSHFFIQSATNSVFDNATARTVMSYDGGQGGDAAATIVHAMLMFVAVFGWYWALKGLYLIHRSGHPQITQQGDMNRGVLRLIGAVGATNMLFITNLIATTGGFHNPLNI